MRRPSPTSIGGADEEEAGPPESQGVFRVQVGFKAGAGLRKGCFFWN